MLRLPGILFVPLILAWTSLARAQECKHVGELPDEEQRWAIRQMQERSRKQAAIWKEMIRSGPVVQVRTDSLSMSGWGLGAFGAGGSGPFPFQLENGVLHIAEREDFEEGLLYFQFDAGSPFARSLKLLQDQKGMAEYYGPNLKSVRTPEELAALGQLRLYEKRLEGPLALNASQIEKIREGYRGRQKLAIELSEFVKSKKQKPDNSVLAEKITQKYEELKKALAFQEREGALFTPEQRRVLGCDPNPNAVMRSRTSISASVSAGEDEESFEKMLAAQKAEENALRAGAKLKFALKGYGADTTNTYAVQLKTGMLWMFTDALLHADGARYTFALEPLNTWDAKKAKWLEGYDPKQAKNEKEAKEIEAGREWLQSSGSEYAYQCGRGVSSLGQKAGSVPPEMQSRLEALIKEIDAACGVLQTAYEMALAKPGDAAVERTLFEAMRQAVKIRKRNEALCESGSTLDPDGEHNYLPWLFNREQLDLVSQGMTTMGTQIINGGTIELRDAGDKQYVGANTRNLTLIDLAESLLPAARKYFHNHKLTLVVDPAAAEKPVRGMVEGKSAEELFQSLATRSGTKLVKNEKDPNAWALNP